MKQETVYKAATAAAAALAEGRQPHKSWIQAIAWQLQRGRPTEQKAFEAFLRDFEQPRLLRLVSRIPNEAGASSALPDPLGETLTLFKPTLPGETQARLAYECFLDGFLAYLQRTHCICTLRETPAHVTLSRAHGAEGRTPEHRSREAQRAACRSAPGRRRRQALEAASAESEGP